jgi:hypothetical protein
MFHYKKGKNVTRLTANNKGQNIYDEVEWILE